MRISDWSSDVCSSDLVHANGELVSDYEISPDGRTLAFRQNYDAYVTPLMPGGQDVSLGIKSSALPVTRVSGSGAEYMHWSDGGRRLHWSRGATLLSADLANRSEEHTAELQSLMRISYAVFRL